MIKKTRKSALAIHFLHRASLRFDVISKAFAMAVVMSSTLIGLAQNSRQLDSRAFLVRMSESTIDNERTTTKTDCIQILADGRFYVERRMQQPPSATATLKIFESSLTSIQLDELRQFLNSETIRNLPPRAAPKLPVQANWYQVTTLQISRGTETQNGGYWTWKTGDPSASLDSPSSNVKKNWQESQASLKPLVQWLHGVEASQLQPSAAEPTGCDFSD